MKCERCGKDLTEQWKKYKTYKGEEEHHNPPKFMMEKWQGTLHDLCVDCHDKLHIEVIKILNKQAGLLKFCNSEYWVWKKMSMAQRLVAMAETIEFTIKYIKKEDDTNTTSR